MNVLVTGGAGYIGSHTCKELKSQGHHPVVVDNLVYGHKWAVKWGPFYVADINETEKIVEILRKEKIDAVIHFAAFAYVGESVREPLKYYENNVTGTLSLLRAMKQVNVKKIIFSSSCATYGLPKIVPINENSEQNPINPYGQTKLIVEKILRDLHVAQSLGSVALRYFNAAGADAELEIGEDHVPETHVIPLAIEAALKSDSILTIFGDDYNTPDGTCIRDYIHVSDLASAHVMALDYLQNNHGAHFFNLGTGRGHSVLEIVNCLERMLGEKVKFKMGLRREGDPDVLVADATKAKSVLGWEPQHSNLENILLTASSWFKQNTNKD